MTTTYAGAVTLNHNGASRRCKDLTSTWLQGDSTLNFAIADAMDGLPGLRKLAVRNHPAGSDPLNRVLCRSRDTLEEISIEETTGMVYYSRLVDALDPNEG